MLPQPDTNSRTATLSVDVPWLPLARLVLLQLLDRMAMSLKAVVDAVVSFKSKGPAEAEGAGDRAARLGRLIKNILDIDNVAAVDKTEFVRLVVESVDGQPAQRSIVVWRCSADRAPPQAMASSRRV